MGFTQKNLQVVPSGDVTPGGLAASASASSPCPPLVRAGANPQLYLTHFPLHIVDAATQPSLFPLGWKNSSGMGKGGEWEEGATEDELKESVSLSEIRRGAVGALALVFALVVCGCGLDQMELTLNTRILILKTRWCDDATNNSQNQDASSG